ncbi:MAG: flagellar biosynthesis protein [Lachnospiraceae bacterium]|nr:flagellar biosynthesis protein [Lachnospiraceae bacterium]
MIGNVNQISSVKKLQLQQEVAAAKGKSFDTILKEQLSQSGTLQFSKHATARAQQRGIEMSNTFLTGLNEAVEKARMKGVKDVVVIADNGAFIVNVPNNVVVTTVDKSEMKDNIFTNIDSAVIM